MSENHESNTEEENENQEGANPKARLGCDNGSYKHGGWMRHLTVEERTTVEQDIADYLATYPYLDEPVLIDLLYEYEVMKIRLGRVRDFILDPDVPEKDKIGAEKLSDSLRRTMSLYATRMGITYVSRQRKKEVMQKKTPFDLMRENEERRNMGR